MWGMEQRGASHVELILSFVLFISAVGFALYYLSPTESSRLIDSSMEYTFREILKYTQVQVDSYDVAVVRGSALSQSIGAVNLEKFFLGSQLPGSNVRVDDVTIPASSARIAAELQSPDHLLIEFTNLVLSPDKPRFLSVKIGGSTIKQLSSSSSPVPCLEKPILNCASTDECCYQIASSDSKMVVSEEEFKILVTKYNTNYDTNPNGLKQSFNLPNRIDFTFSLEFVKSDGTTDIIQPSGGPKPPQGVDVYRETRRVEVLRTNDNLQFGDLTVGIW